MNVACTQIGNANAHRYCIQSAGLLRYSFFGLLDWVFRGSIWFFLFFVLDVQYFLQAGLTMGNLTAPPAEPVGHIAGTEQV